jgi:hypothetical protein
MGSMGCDDLSSKDSYCLSPNAGGCVNGIPDWENPMEATLTVPKNETSPPMWKAKPPIDTRRRKSLNNSSSDVVKHPVSPQKHVQALNPAYFSKMVIECDSDDKFNHSDGELTFDESLAQDENFGRNQPNYQIPKEVMNREKKPPMFQSPTQIPPRTTSMRSNSGLSHPSMSTSSSSIPVSPGMSLEEEEMRQLEIAMERSLQDYNSCTSNGNGSLTSERSYSNNIASRYSHRNIDSGNGGNIGAGCHLSMVSSFRNNHTSPSKLSSQNRMDGLHAIVEENEASNRSFGHLNFQDHRHYPQQTPNRSNQYNSGEFRSANINKNVIDPQIAAERLRELEREKEILEMVLKQSSDMRMADVNNNEIHFQPPPTSVRPTLRSNRSINSMNTSELMIPRRNPVTKSASVRPTDVSAGCHLQMYAARAQSSRQLLNNDSSSGHSLNYANNNNSQSNASTSSSNNTTKMIWKRGPNGAWGRFVDDGIDYSSNNNSSNNHSTNDVGVATNNNNHHYQNHNPGVSVDDEEAQIAEALRRSMEQM